MLKHIKIWFMAGIIFIPVALLSGCYHETSLAAYPEDYTPSLRVFDMIDSYDQDTGVEGYHPLALNPYLYDGLFEVFWQVDSLEDYTLTLWINDRPTLTNALPIDTEVCGQGHWCDQGGNLVCDYTSDFYLSCDNSDHPLDIAPLFTQVPQQLYLLMSACDINSDYCEYDYYPVSFE